MNTSEKEKKKKRRVSMHAALTQLQRRDLTESIHVVVGNREEKLPKWKLIIYCDGKCGFTAGSPGTALRGRFISEKKGSLDAPSLVALPPALSFSDHCETANSCHCTSPVPIHLQRFQATQRQQPQPGSGMRAVFLSSPSARRESAGTGVFLPRIGGDKSEPPKKPGTDLFSFVLLRRIFGCLSVLLYALLLLRSEIVFLFIH
ncbi:hypothetical protein C4D60_Mb10t15960 [Musa balbisiana]|uniref:Uncharacterized protein n=1 Tax=Musa balbisiana TaxID=52838 RepID=A0A4S8IYW1_MUSBA|nr:hypothetical protein C4D60_Mb10t15960 [Musa balbisiana]